MEKNRFTICANNYIDCLRQEGRYSTAHVYKHAIRSFSQFCGTQSITFSRINRETLKRYSNYLLASRLKPNTISTYMRMLRSIYNRGVDTHQAPYVHGLFRDVFTGVDTRQKKAIPIGELHILLNKDPQSEKLRRTSHTSEYFIHQPDMGALRRDKRTDLSQQRNQCRLTQKR